MDEVRKTITLRSSQLRQIETLGQMCFEAFKATKSDKKKESKRNKRHRNDKRSNNKGDKKPKVKCNYCQRLGHTEEQCWVKNPELRQKSKPKQKGQKTESVNALTTFEFTNRGVDRHYEEPDDSDTSVNTQFEAMELEEDQHF